MKESRQKELGQVFTNENVAKMMVELLKPYLNDKSNCLDPCIGKNIFFNELVKYPFNKLMGIEVDNEIIDDTTRLFYKKPNRALLNEDFFNFPIENQFDIIIMNPPYIRQELLESKNNLCLDKDIKLPKKSNLYIYFLLKALKHLKSTGHLVAIVYDSWLYTEYGKVFKEIIAKRYSIDKIIHFKHGAFENVNVGATVILFSKNKNTQEIEYHLYNSPEEIKSYHSLNENLRKINLKELTNFHCINGINIDFDSEIFTKISELSNKPLNRGMNALVNKFFIFSKNEYPPLTKKIIKDITKVKKYEVNGDYDYILILDENSVVKDKRIKDHIEKIYDELKNNPENYKDLSNKIKEKKNWFVVKEREPGNIIFNYYIRNSPHFIYNPEGLLVSDNFYNIYVNENIFEILSILNSNITKATLYKFSRSQGRGLFKIQLQQFKDLPIINPGGLDNKSKERLNQLGQKLISIDRNNSHDIIEEIDSILIEEINKNQNKRLNKEEIHLFIDKIKGVSNE